MDLSAKYARVVCESSESDRLTIWPASPSGPDTASNIVSSSVDAKVKYTHSKSLSSKF